MKSMIFLFVTASLMMIFSGLGLADKPNKEWIVLEKGDPYTADWKKVAQADKDGLPKSAMELVRAIYEKAKKSNNYTQQIKALIHILKYHASIEEEGTVVAIGELEREIMAAPYPVRPVLESFQAQLMWSYFENNRWRFYDRTETTDSISADIRTWPLSRLIARVSELYLSSIANADSLQRTKLSLFDETLVTYSGSKVYRPTLYDLLAHRALEYFQNDEKEVIKPQFEFELNDSRALVPAAEFARMKFSTPDSSSMKFTALLVYQELIRSHLSDPDPDALVDLDLMRLAFARKHTFDENKDDKYLKTLLDMAQEFKRYPIVTQIQYTIAQYYYALPDPVVTDESETPVSNRRKAYEICESAIKTFPGSRGAVNCESLRSYILEKSITVQSETTVPPGKDFRIALDYKNVSKVYFRIIKGRNRVDDDDYDNEKYIKWCLRQKAIDQWTQQLTAETDFKSHKTEIRVKGLPLGFYTIIASADPSFRQNENALMTLDVWVTGLSLITESTRYNGDNNFYVLNSQNGNPLQGVKVESRYQQYNYKSYRYEWKKGPTYKTDEEGRFTVKAANEYRYFRFILSYGEDKFIPYENIYTYSYGPSAAKDKITTKFFTDRSIYRPGQTVYFKGIMFQSDPQNLKHKVLPERTSRVVFYDVNHQKISELSLTTNEYGAFSGTFIAPTGKLNGRMKLQNESGSVDFYVEEYKRPKFEVEFKPVTESYKVDEKVKVNGIAKAYAGSTIDGAQVKYRVVREGFFPYWRRYWGMPPSILSKEIAHGTVTTDAKGEFSVEFTALPDRSMPKSSLPQFAYTVYADVTDVSGETRSGQTAVSVGYIALSASIESPQAQRREDTLILKLHTLNLNGEFEPAQGRLTIERLEQPGRVMRERLWGTPDRHSINEQDYIRYFPNDVYQKEDDWAMWKRTETVFDRQVNTKEKARYEITDLTRQSPGVYFIQFDTKDRYGMPVKVERYMTLFSESGNDAAEMTPFYLYPLESSYEPGDTVRFLIGTAYEDVRIYSRLEQQGRELKTEWIELNRSQKVISIPVEESYRGGLTAHFSFVKNQRLYSQSQYIYVPWSNKDLKVEFATFRDKLQPGEKDQWRIIIKGHKTDQVAAEMVATLYDASLDAFRPHRWNWSVMPWLASSSLSWSSQTFSAKTHTNHGSEWNKFKYGHTQYYDALNDFGFPFYVYWGWGGSGRGYAETGVMTKSARSSNTIDDRSVALPSSAGEKLDEFTSKDKPKELKRKKNGGGDDEDGVSPPPPPKKANGGDDEDAGDDMKDVKARTNLNETAFFYPHLKTNEQGEIIIQFTIPEALTRWRMMGIAHTPGLDIGYVEKTLVTQKELMVQPNAPRFLRESDEFYFAAKVSNLSEQTQSARVRLYLFDAMTMQPVDKLFDLPKGEQTLTINAGESAPAFWKIKVPKGVSAVTYRVVAKAGEFSDGEESTLPVLPNSMLVTESLPLPIRGKQKKTFEFKKLMDSKKSKTLTHERLTLEMTSNPAWYAVQAMPYMMEYPYECSEQVYSRFYANAITTHIANSNPKIKRVFDAWKDTPALESNLMKNQELKSLMLEETPWVISGQKESQRKKQVGLLFDVANMQKQLESALKKLREMQTPNGGWPWFAGMPDDRYITQHIVTGFGHLQVLGIKPDQYGQTSGMLKKAVEYLDYKMNEDYQYLLKYKIELDRDNLGYAQMHYLYARSYFMDQAVPSKYKTAFDYWKNQAQLYWKSWNKMGQGMIALALHRMKDAETPKAIMKSIKEYALYSEEMGMYWKSDFGYYWYQAPIETQALLIEAFDEVMNDQESVEAMKVWLLKQKQTQDWKTTKATAEACYALLRRGTDMLASDQLVEIALGGDKLDMKEIKESAEAGTGYFKKSWERQDIKSSMGKVTLDKKDDGVAWGALYWQYFEELDKITPHETPLKLTKKLYIQRTTDKGLVLEPITGKNKIQIGDVVVVRIELRVDRAMEYVHMKDMRAAGFEPVNVISRYKWQDGLGYYESTKDASTNFFISWLPKGTFVFEYSLRATLKGDFQNGITTIQCMYAPEFTSHSEGVKVKIE